MSSHASTLTSFTDTALHGQDRLALSHKAHLPTWRHAARREHTSSCRGSMVTALLRAKAVSASLTRCRGRGRPVTSLPVVRAVSAPSVPVPVALPVPVAHPPLPACSPV